MKIYDYVEQQRNLILYSMYPNQEELTKDLGMALDRYRELSESKEIEEADREKFWNDLEDVLSDRKDRWVWRHYSTLKEYELAVRNASLCMDKEREYIGCAKYTQHQDGIDVKVRVYLPAEKDGLSKLLAANGIDEQKAADGFECEQTMLEDMIFDIESKKLYELNYLCYQISKMSEADRTVYNRALMLLKPQSIKDMINLTANCDGIMVLNISDRRTLGQFLVENELFEVDFDNKVLPFLNYTKIADWHIQTHNGLLADAYIENTRQPEEMIEIYDGINLPSFSISGEQRQTADQTMNL